MDKTFHYCEKEKLEEKKTLVLGLDLYFFNDNLLTFKFIQISFC